ncbi:alpha/beta fold hydrolase [Nocardioides psychrotolerans]|uniref:esterase/lipase family protein n=1 Tax=Nocardioides psychrotolerans TaxID=1005945 RepID=UPI003137DAEE
MRIILGALVALVLSLVAALGAVAPAGAGSGSGFPLPLPTSPAGDPPGANDWSCRPTEQRPTPVILVHGTIGDRKNLLEGLSAAIKAAGFCVYSLDYGNRGTGDMVRSARQLAAFTSRVLRSTGAEKVSMVGHSQGGLLPRYYIKFLGGARVVDDLVGVAPSNHGTALVPFGGAGLAGGFGILCRACTQQAAGSAFLTKLNRGDETPGSVSYTQITTRYDEVVVPHTSGYLAAGPRTVNLTIQDKCPLDPAEHLLIPLSRTTIALTLDALIRPGPARAGLAVAC